MASRLFAVDLDLGLNKAKQFVFEDFNTDPTSATGRVYFNTTGGRLKVYNGTAWKSVAYTDDLGNNTTYDLAAGGTTSPTISLTGSDSTTDTVTFSAGTGISLGQSAGTITITNTVANTDTTYDLTTSGTSTATISLVPSSGTTDSFTITGSGATSVSHSTGAITISSTDNNYYPSAIVFNAGTTSGPTLDLTMSGSGAPDLTAVAIPSASSTASGIVTTAAQTFAGTKTFSNDVVITGDLTVNGNTTTLNTATLSVEDNIVLLNNGVTGTPSLNAGIEVERGTSTNASITWNESTDTWTAGLTGSELPIARKYVETITTTGGSAYTVTHNLGTSDVIVQTYLSNSLVDCDIDISSSSAITVTTNSSATIRVVVIG